MKVLYLVDYYQPQLGYSEFYIPRELAKLGHQVWILTSNYYFPFPHYNESSGKLLGNREQKPGISYQDDIVVIKEKMVAEIFTRAIFANHKKYLEIINPDLVIVNKSSGYNVIRMAQLKNQFKYKLISYDAHLPSGFYATGNLLLKHIFYTLFKLFFSKLLNDKVDKFVAVQEKTIDIMEEFYGQKNIVHIPLGTDMDIFKFDPKHRNLVRKSNHIPKDAFVIGYSGKLIATKGLDILFAAFNHLKSKHNDLYLLLVGNGDDRYLKECWQKVDPQYQKDIIILGFQANNQLYKYYSAFDVGVWPLEESTSMNDVAACKLPFIANDEIGAKIRLSNHNALTYKKGDALDLAKKIELLYKNKERRIKMGENGFDLIKNKLSWPKITQQYLKYV